MPRTPEHTVLNQWPLPDGRVATTVHHIDADGDESIELSGIHERIELAIAPEQPSEVEQLLALNAELVAALRAAYSDIQRLPGHTIAMLGRIERAVVRAEVRT